MVMKPKILLLDEPLSALDGVIKESIKEKIKEIAREFHLTTIIVTHDPEEALTLCRFFGCEAAVLKERSPSCGHGRIYDGTFTGTLTAGDGVAAELLAAQGLAVYGESQISELLK